MKNYLLKPLLMIFATATAILLTPKMTFAQVDYSSLTEVAKSCQVDVLSPEYYEKIGFSVSKVGFDDPDPIVIRAQYDPYYLASCIKARYYHLLVLSKLPWLASSGNIISGYPGAAAVSLISLNYEQGQAGSTTGVLECLVSQDSGSQECSNSGGFWAAFNLSSSDSKIKDMTTPSLRIASYIYMCPSCTVAVDETLSMEKMTDAFIKWFLTLDKPRRREVMSILGDEDAQRANRRNMEGEAQKAVQEYKQARQRVEQKEQEQRKVDILGK